MKRKLSLIMAVVMTLTMVFGYVGKIDTKAERIELTKKSTTTMGELEYI